MRVDPRWQDAHHDDMTTLGYLEDHPIWSVDEDVSSGCNRNREFLGFVPQFSQVFLKTPPKPNKAVFLNMAVI